MDNLSPTNIASEKKGECGRSLVVRWYYDTLLRGGDGGRQVPPNQPSQITTEFFKI
jgi:hypothetical protein